MEMEISSVLMNICVMSEECLLDDLSRDLPDPDEVCCGAGERCLGELSLLVVAVDGGDILRGSDRVLDDGDGVVVVLDGGPVLLSILLWDK